MTSINRIWAFSAKPTLPFSSPFDHSSLGAIVSSETHHHHHHFRRPRSIAAAPGRWEHRNREDVASRRQEAILSNMASTGVVLPRQRPSRHRCSPFPSQPRLPILPVSVPLGRQRLAPLLFPSLRIRSGFSDRLCFQFFLFILSKCLPWSYMLLCQVTLFSNSLIM